MAHLKNEIPILDNLRAIAAWSVCLCHLICSTIGFINPKSITYIIFSYGSYGVQLFFVISGFIIPWSLYTANYKLKNVFRFLAKRFIRLEPPYIVSILITLSIGFLRKYSPAYNYYDVPISTKQLLLHIGYLVPFFKNVTWVNNIYWTLAIEFQYYLVIGIFYFLFISSKKTIRFLAYSIFFILPYLIENQKFLPFWLPLFGIGILLFLFKTKQIKKTELIIVSFIFYIHILFFNQLAAFIVVLFSEVVIIFMYNYSNKFLAYLGKTSYSVYLMHAIIGASAVNLLSHYSVTNLDKIGIIIIGIIISFVSSQLMFLFIEQPSKNLSRKISYIDRK